MQDTFARIHRRIDTLLEADRLAAWVYRIARNGVDDHYREIAANAIGTSGGDAVDEAEDRPNRLRSRATEWMDELIRQLPEKYREAVQLAEIEGLTSYNSRLGDSLFFFPPPLRLYIPPFLESVGGVADFCLQWDY